MSLSPQVTHVLWLALNDRDVSYVPLVDGKGSQSRTVGRGVSVDVARRAGYLDADYKLTDAGRAAYKSECDRQARLYQLAQRKALAKHTHWEHGDRCHGLWTNDLNGARRLGRVSIGPKGLWDGKTYRWAVDQPGGGGGYTHGGEETSLKAAKIAVENICSGAIR